MEEGLDDDSRMTATTRHLDTYNPRSVMGFARKG